MSQALTYDDAPRLLFRDWETGAIDLPTLRDLILPVWVIPEDPLAELSLQCWIQLFRAAGFVSDTGRAAPTEPLEVWRAQKIDRDLGLSWSPDRAVAEKFYASNLRLGKPSVLLRAHVKPLGVLAFADAVRPGEHEVVVCPEPSSFVRLGRVAACGS